MILFVLVVSLYANFARITQSENCIIVQKPTLYLPPYVHSKYFQDRYRPLDSPQIPLLFFQGELASLIHYFSWT